MEEDRGRAAAPTDAEEEDAPQDVHSSRLQLIWDVLLFQFKLVADGLRDLLLSPISIIAGILGLIAGGDDPHQYFRRLLAIGRRSDVWINLFGGHHGGTSDEMVDPVRKRVFDEAQANPWINRAGTHLNQRLDRVNSGQQRPPEPRDES
jgi:hypothetical protein